MPHPPTRDEVSCINTASKHSAKTSIHLANSQRRPKPRKPRENSDKGLLKPYKAPFQDPTKPKEHLGQPDPYLQELQENPRRSSETHQKEQKLPTEFKQTEKHPSKNQKIKKSKKFLNNLKVSYKGFQCSSSPKKKSPPCALVRFAASSSLGTQEALRPKIPAPPPREPNTP